MHERSREGFSRPYPSVSLIDVNSLRCQFIHLAHIHTGVCYIKHSCAAFSQFTRNELDSRLFRKQSVIVQPAPEE